MKKRIIALCFVFVLIAMLGVSALASAPATTSGVGDVMKTAFQGMVTDLMDSVIGILPIVLPIMGLSVGIGFSIKWFKKITSKAG